MALNGTAYAVELDRMQAAFGSRDHGLLARVVEEHAAEPGDTASPGKGKGVGSR